LTNDVIAGLLILANWILIFINASLFFRQKRNIEETKKLNDYLSRKIESLQ